MTSYFPSNAARLSVSISDEDLIDDDAAGVDVAAREPEEHERVVRIRAVRDGDCVF